MLEGHNIYQPMDLGRKLQEAKLEVGDIEVSRWHATDCVCHQLPSRNESNVNGYSPYSSPASATGSA